MTQSGSKNPNWRGGRVKTSHGYILIRVGKKHHLSDCRGYAYEHRVVAEEKLDRRLRPGEQVHHLNGDKTDNRPENIDIRPSRAWHAVSHRKSQNLRLPGEKNSMILCSCGCGQKISKYDQWGRPRSYVSGHNPMPAEMQTEILRILERGALHRNQIARLVGKSVTSTAQTLSRLKTKGLVRQLGRGVWALSDT